MAATEGLLQLMNDDELDGVIAHELGHVRNYDILDGFRCRHPGRRHHLDRPHGAVGHDLWRRALADDDRGGGGIITALAMIILAPIAAMIMQLAISRQREYAADASSARLVGHPYGLISALEKLGAYNKRIPMDVPPATSSLFIVAPLSAGQVFSGLFSTHPPLEKRIAALREHGDFTLRQSSHSFCLPRPRQDSAGAFLS